MSPGLFTADMIVSSIEPRRVGCAVKVFEQLDSTNRLALDHLRENATDGLVVIAERQTAGRGRLGRQWECPLGAGILCTVAVVDKEDCVDANLLSLVVPVALTEAIIRTTMVRAEIKWPNDLVVGRRKLGGVLIERCVAAEGGVGFAIGFGINCLQHPGHFAEELRGRSTSLDIESPHAIDRLKLLQSVLIGLDRWLSEPGTWDTGEICTRWKSHSRGLGERVTLRHHGRLYSGNVVDIDPSAALVVQLDQGGRRLFEASSTTVVDQHE